MNKLILFFILMFASRYVYSSELTIFENNLDMIRNSATFSEDKKHLAIYQHTLNVGAHCLDYMSSRASVNGLFLTLVRDSWEAYIALQTICWRR